MATPQDAGFTGVTGSADTASIESLFSSLDSEIAATPTITTSGTNSKNTTTGAKVTATQSSAGSASAATTHVASSHASVPSIVPDAASSGLTTGAKAGIGVAIALLVAILLASALVYKRQRSKRARPIVGAQNNEAKREHTRGENLCVYHAKPELEDTSNPRTSLGNLLPQELDSDALRGRDSTAVAELEVRTSITESGTKESHNC
jgi:hypothetical protein